MIVSLKEKYEINNLKSKKGNDDDDKSNPIWVNLALKGLNHGYLENEVLNHVQNQQKLHRGRSDQVPKSRPFWLFII